MLDPPLTTVVLPYMHVCTMYILLSRLLYSPTCMCVQCTYFYHDCCTPLHACVYNVHTSITTAVLPYMHVCTMYILLSRLLYSPTCMCVQCTYFYHDCCTPLHACVYNVHTSITSPTCMLTAGLPYMHMYRFLVVIGFVGGGSFCDSGVCGADGGCGIPSGTTRQ